MSESAMNTKPIAPRKAILGQERTRSFDAGLPRDTIARFQRRRYAVDVSRMEGGVDEPPSQDWRDDYRENTIRSKLGRLCRTASWIAGHDAPDAAGAVSAELGTGQEREQCVDRPESEPDGEAQEVLDALVDPSTDHVRLRQLVIAAEAIEFSEEQDRKLIPALMRFIKSFRDSNDWEDHIAVCAAIRTYVGAVRAEEIDTVSILLDPKHRTSATLDVVLETLKMIRRKLTVNPPSTTDSHPVLSDHVERLASAYLDPYVFPHGKHAAVAMNAVQSLGGLASRRIVDVIDQVNRLCPRWFRRQLRRRLGEQHAEWTTRSPIPADERPPIRLIEEALERLRAE